LTILFNLKKPSQKMVTTRASSKSPNKLNDVVTNSRREDFPGFARQPTDEPPFMLGQLRRAIPAHCFKRSTLRSSLYLIADLVLIAALYVASTFIDTAPVSATARWALWATYWFFQGAVATGVWVIGHECGHQSFSESQAINDAVGLLFHSLLLVPYFSWKHSHRRHHSNTNSIAKDEVFVPEDRPLPTEEPEYFQQNGFVRLFWLIISSTLGWPLYLFFNIASRPYPNNKWVNHFDPWSPIFSKRERVEVAISDAALIAVCYGLTALGNTFGWAWLLKSYGIPYLVVNFWLVTITMLQHTHPSLPHYNDKEWNWLRGALATVDRDYGWFLNTVQHNIQDTHVAHHLFSQIPHYHAKEATKAIKEVLGEYYVKDERPLLTAIWEAQACRYVSPDVFGKSGILWQRR
jgi:omega-6 fatty acid desaturase (delta-12 desaturase)